MTEQEQRLTRFAVVCFMALLLTAAAIIFFFSVEVQKVRNLIASYPTTIVGERGLQGYDGLNGLSVVGPVGATGLQGAQGIQGLQGEKGEKGDQGIQGVPGKDGKNGKNGLPARELELCRFLDGILGQRYIGDFDCSPIDEVAQ